MLDKIAEKVFEEAKDAGYAVSIALAVIVGFCIVFMLIGSFFS